MARRPIDRQRSLVYAFCEALKCFKFEDPRRILDEAGLSDTQLRVNPRLKVTNLAFTELNLIETTKEAATDGMVLLHEMAHIIDAQHQPDPRRREPHGPRFVGHFIDLMDRFSEFQKNDLEIAAYIAGVKSTRRPRLHDFHYRVRGAASLLERVQGWHNSHHNTERSLLIRQVAADAHDFKLLEPHMKACRRLRIEMDKEHEQTRSDRALAAAMR